MSRRARGFTLAEVLFAATIVGVALVAVTNAMSSVTTSKAELADQPVQAAHLAQDIAVLAETLPRTPSGHTGATTGSAVTALDSLQGAAFSPPIRSDRSTDTSLAGWKQAVTVEIFKLDNLTTPTNESVGTALSQQASRLYRLNVTIWHGTQKLETFRSWCRP
jgi:prepilin-type N-terminal cleavage/methylation domain-containing protein